MAGVLVQARAVMSDERVAAAGVSTLRDQSPATGRDWQRIGLSRRRLRRCWNCGWPGHFATVCPQAGNDMGCSCQRQRPLPEIS